ncbi:MAG: bifunctional histidinol-phosphatase/imidazoleglycerol-phosphate dehydratase HisB [Bacteroidaceae bacterium]|nr:bifunctional histidinol-phosphatase/imidazoleglycerol-phosphate dehydratase HisB [Bacteroidaceae bacterium]
MNKKKALFIDRDGTIIFEPPVTEQVDTLEQLEFMPGVICALSRISQLGYELVMATNQDGLGTDVYPTERFDTVQGKVLSVLRGEGVVFDDILIDNHFPEDGSPMRKPNTGMFGKYLTGEYDLASSYVIGDRQSDAELAENLGAKCILYNPQTNPWNEIAELLCHAGRSAVIHRQTGETDIEVAIDLDGRGDSHIDTGLCFLNHMLDQIVHHAGISLSVIAKGDLNVDEHHTMEDVAIVLGQAIIRALGDKLGIGRYGFVLPMDECRALVLMDLGGRIDFQWDVHFTREYVGDVPTEMFRHFFKSLCAAMNCNLHIQASGDNNHHLAEAVFKAFARALRMAIRCEPFSHELPSSKGLI